MTDADTYGKVLHRAVALLARRARSRGELRERLSKFAELPTVERVLNRLEELELLNDADYAYNFASRRVRQDGWGPLKVRSHLLRRFVAPDVIETTLDRVRGEIGEAAALESWLDRELERRPVADAKSLRRLIAAVRRRGFRDETIYDVLRRRIPSGPWRNLGIGD